MVMRSLTALAAIVVLALVGDVAMEGSALFREEIAKDADVQADPRFNKEIDKKTGFTTASILCVQHLRHFQTLPRCLHPVGILLQQFLPYDVLNHRRTSSHLLLLRQYDD